MPESTVPHPDAPLTASALERAIRASLPPGAPGIGQKTILAELRAGRLQGARVGRWWRVTWRAYLAWLEAQRVAPSPDATPRGDAAAWAAAKIADEENRAAG